MLFQLPCDEAHHDFRAANHRDRFGRLQARVLEQGCDDAYVPVPAQAAIVHRDQDLRVRLARPRCQLFAIKQFTRTARAVQDNQAPVTVTVAEDLINRWTEWRQPDSSRNDDYIAASCGFHGPSGAERPANADPCSRLLAHQSMRRLANRTHGVHEFVAVSGIPTDRDRQLTNRSEE